MFSSGGLLELYSTRCSYEEIWHAVRVLRSGKYILGDNVAALESEIAKFLGVEPERVVTCASGTDALTLALENVYAYGREIVVPALTFSATYEAVLRVGATPVVADLDIGHLTPSLELIERAVTDKTAAVVVVHMYGWPAPEILAIRDFCDAKEIALIEDTAQAFGASIDGLNVATIGDFGAISFYPTKPLGGVGDGGAVVFKNKLRAHWSRGRRNHGRVDGKQVMPGYNSRFDEVNAAVLRRRLARYPDTLKHLREIADRYDGLLGSVSIAKKSNSLPAPYVYPIMVSDRDRIAAELADVGIKTGIHYDPPISGLPYVTTECPVANRAMKSQLSLPCHREVEIADVDWIAEVILG